MIIILICVMEYFTSLFEIIAVGLLISPSFC